MKLFGNFEASGITKVVFYSTGEAWDRVDTEDEPVWVSDTDFNFDRCRNHKDMINIIKRKINDPCYRIWTHGESMNIVPSEE